MCWIISLMLQRRRASQSLCYSQICTTGRFAERGKLISWMSPSSKCWAQNLLLETCSNPEGKSRNGGIQENSRNSWNHASVLHLPDLSCLRNFPFSYFILYLHSELLLLTWQTEYIHNSFLHQWNSEQKVFFSLVRKIITSACYTALVCDI